MLSVCGLFDLNNSSMSVALVFGKTDSRGIPAKYDAVKITGYFNAEVTTRCKLAIDNASRPCHSQSCLVKNERRMMIVSRYTYSTMHRRIDIHM